MNIFVKEEHTKETAQIDKAEPKEGDRTKLEAKRTQLYFFGKRDLYVYLFNCCKFHKTTTSISVVAETVL